MEEAAAVRRVSRSGCRRRTCSPTASRPEQLDLEGYHYLHSTRAELLRRLDRVDEARAAYKRALELVHSDAERRFLERRLGELPPT